MMDMFPQCPWKRWCHLFMALPALKLNDRPLLERQLCQSVIRYSQSGYKYNYWNFVNPCSV
jgi:hypothetical protein